MENAIQDCADCGGPMQKSGRRVILNKELCEECTIRSRCFVSCLTIDCIALQWNPDQKYKLWVCDDCVKEDIVCLKQKDIISMAPFAPNRLNPVIGFPRNVYDQFLENRHSEHIGNVDTYTVREIRKMQFDENDIVPPQPLPKLENKMLLDIFAVHGRMVLHHSVVRAIAKLDMLQNELQVLKKQEDKKSVTKMFRKEVAKKRAESYIVRALLKMQPLKWRV